MINVRHPDPARHLAQLAQLTATTSGGGGHRIGGFSTPQQRHSPHLQGGELY